MKKPLIIGAFVAAGLFGSGVAIGQIAGIPGTHAASPAATSTTASGSSGSTSATAPDQGRPDANFPAHGTASHENAEKAVTGSAASQAQAAAVKSVGSGTAGPVTSTFDGNGYEVTVTKTDGSTVDVRMDSSFNVDAGH